MRRPGRRSALAFNVLFDVFVSIVHILPGVRPETGGWAHGSTECPNDITVHHAYKANGYQAIPNICSAIW